MRNSANESGMSLMAALVAVGIAGIVGVGVMRILSTSFEGQASLELRTERVALARSLLGRVSCANSFSNTTCPSSEMLNILDQNNKVIISKRGTIYGKWTARAECNSDNNGVVVKVALLKKGFPVTTNNNNHFLKDPLTKKVMSFSSSLSLLYPPSTNLCPDGSSGTNTGEGGSGAAPGFKICGMTDRSCESLSPMMCLTGAGSNTLICNQVIGDSGSTSCRYNSKRDYWERSNTDENGGSSPCGGGVLALIPPVE